MTPNKVQQLGQAAKSASSVDSFWLVFGTFDYGVALEQINRAVG